MSTNFVKQKFGGNGAQNGLLATAKTNQGNDNNNRTSSNGKTGGNCGQNSGEKINFSLVFENFCIIIGE